MRDKKIKNSDLKQKIIDKEFYKWVENVESIGGIYNDNLLLKKHLNR